MKRLGISILITAGIFLNSLIGNAATNSFGAYSLKCDNLEMPSGIESRSPMLSWKCHSTNRDFHQSQYRVLVASSPDKLTEESADLWDSGWVKSPQSLMIKYEGKDLSPATTYYWTVNIADNTGRKSSYTAPSLFTTGLYAPTDWHGAQWIALEPDGEIIVPHIDSPVAQNLRPEKKYRAE